MLEELQILAIHVFFGGIVFGALCMGIYVVVHDAITVAILPELGIFGLLLGAIGGILYVVLVIAESIIKVIS